MQKYNFFNVLGKTNLFESHCPVSKTTKVDEITGSKPKPIEQSNGLSDISLNEAELTELAEKMETEDVSSINLQAVKCVIISIFH